MEVIVFSVSIFALIALAIFMLGVVVGRGMNNERADTKQLSDCNNSYILPNHYSRERYLDLGDNDWK